MFLKIRDQIFERRYLQRFKKAKPAWHEDDITLHGFDFEKLLQVQLWL